MRRGLVSIGLASLMLGVSGAFALQPQNPGAAPAKPGVKAPARKADKKAQDLLKAAGEAMAKVEAFGYRATLAGEGAASGDTPRYDAQVVASRAQAGGWRLYAKGDVTPPGGKRAEFEIGFDGVTARAIRPDAQEVVERSFKDMGEVPTFFAGQQARPVVAWALLGEKPFEAMGARASYEGMKTIDGVMLEVVFVAGEGENAAGGERYYFGSDTLPRRIESVADMGQDAMRVLTLGAFATNADAPRASFALPIPDGYRVRYQSSSDRTPGAKAPADKAPSKPGAKPTKPAAKRGNGLLDVGTDAPDWTLKDPKGTEVSLASLRGKVVVLDFWAVWCGPCKAAMPSVQRLHKTYEKSGKVAVFGMNSWERPTNNPEKYMKDSGYTYGLLLKADDVASAYKVTGIPAFYVIGPDGKILWNAVGSNPAHEKEISEVIDAALKGM